MQSSIRQSRTLCTHKTHEHFFNAAVSYCCSNTYRTNTLHREFYLYTKKTVHAHAYGVLTTKNNEKAKAYEVEKNKHSYANSNLCTDSSQSNKPQSGRPLSFSLTRFFALFRFFLLRFYCFAIAYNSLNFEFVEMRYK